MLTAFSDVCHWVKPLVMHRLLLEGALVAYSPTPRGETARTASNRSENAPLADEPNLARKVGLARAYAASPWAASACYLTAYGTHVHSDPDGQTGAHGWYSPVTEGQWAWNLLGLGYGFELCIASVC
jgi:hypothetical protein